MRAWSPTWTSEPTERLAMTLEEWSLVDPALGSFELFALTPDGRYARTLAATEGRVTDVPGCPSLAIDLDELWRELDRLSADA